MLNPLKNQNYGFKELVKQLKTKKRTKMLTSSNVMKNISSSILGNVLLRRWVIRGGKGVTKAGQNFSAASFFN